MSEVKINRLILIGNGFDLAHGLKTSFYDFINFIVYETVLYLETGINNLLGIDNNLFETDDDVRVNYGCLLSFIRNSKPLIPSVGRNDRIIEKIQEIPDKIEEKYDVEYNYIEKYSSLFDENFWMDTINYLLELQIHGNITTIRIKNQLDNTLSGKKLLKNKLFEIIFKNAIPRNEKSKNWGGIEHDFYQTLLYVDKIYEGTNSHEKIDKLNKEFQNILESFIYYMKSIVSEQKPRTMKKIEKHLYQPIKIKELSINLAKKIYQEPIIVNENLFLSFNYTNTIEEYITKYPEKWREKYIQIHGNLNDNLKSIIFGYGDEMDGSYKELEDKNDNRYLKYSKSLRYLFNDNYKKLLNFLENDMYQVYIWGHSCATSDRVLLQTIFEHKNCISIKPFYYQDENGMDNFDDICANISRSFSNKKKLRDLVVSKEYCTTL